MPRKKSPEVPDQAKLLASREHNLKYPQVSFRISQELNVFLEGLVLSDPLVSKDTNVNLFAREALIYWILDKKRLRLKDFPAEIPEIDSKLR